MFAWLSKRPPARGGGMPRQVGEGAQNCADNPSNCTGRGKLSTTAVQLESTRALPKPPAHQQRAWNRYQGKRKGNPVGQKEASGEEGGGVRIETKTHHRQPRINGEPHNSPHDQLGCSQKGTKRYSSESANRSCSVPVRSQPTENAGRVQKSVG